MAADCYLCQKRYSEIPGQAAGDAVGSCKLCGVLACLAHGRRDPNRPAYICGCCVPNLLAAAATRRVDPDHAPPDMDPWARDVETVKDVLPDFDGDDWSAVRSDVEFLSSQLGRSAPKALQSLVGAMDSREQQLLAAAIAIAVRLQLHADELIPTLQLLTASVLQDHV
ncbi:MAG TPA: hypothetical protein VN614_09800 [Rhodanobacter sp.]|nr:hypothetical protein [Rhodanobacter sp.]